MWERRLYRWMTDDSEVRACESIPEEACAEVPRSFVLNAGNGAATKLAEEVASPGLVLAWLLETLGAPVALVGWLEPLRRGASMLPQLLVSAQLRARPVRKWFWVAAGTIQAVVLVLMAAAAWGLDGLAAGIAVLAGLAVFSMASGIGSVAFSDVLGKTVPKGKRGQLLAVRATAGGALTLAAGLALRFGGADAAGRPLYVVLLLAAAVLWAAAAVLFAMIREPAGASEGGRNAISEIREGTGLVLRQRGFRRFLATRSTLLAVELAVPYYALHSRRLGLEAHDLGVAIIAVGVANLVSSPVWGRLSDRVSSRMVMVLAGVVSVAASLTALAVGAFMGAGISALAYAPVFFLAGLAVSGVRLGRKTYLVDATDDSVRPLYVSLSNTLMGGLTFAYGGLGFVAEAAGARDMLVVLLAFAVAGVAVAWWTPEPERMREETAVSPESSS